MASSFEKSVKGGTKIKLAAPKSKYVEHILIATHAGEAGVAEIFRALQNRLRDSTWTIVFKSLIIIHLMIREGEPEVTLRYLSQNPKHKLAINNFTEVQTQGRNIKAYSDYLLQRAVAYGSTKVDYVRGGEGRLKRLTIDKGLLRETECVQDQIKALLKCDFLSHEPENEITLTAFRLLTMDLLVLFHVMNEGTINVLEHYFEMSHSDAQRALGIYRTFAKQTSQVVQYLSVARHYEHATRLEIPRIKHAPTSLVQSLEEYLNDKDFETNRRQYLAQQQAKKNSKGLTKPFGDSKSANSKSESGQHFPSPKQSQSTPAKQEAKRPGPDLIDFFESIEQNQQPMAAPQYQQPNQFPMQTGMVGQATGIPQQTPGLSFQNGPQAVPQQFNPVVAQTTNPFGQPQPQPQQPQPIQPNFTGAGFGGYTPQPQQPFSTGPTLSAIPQNGVASFHQQPVLQSPVAGGDQLQPQSTNPFRQSMMPSATGASGASFGSSLPNRASTNPFAKTGISQQNTGFPSSPLSPISAGAQQQPTFSFPPQPQPLQPAPTGTNPFARNNSPATSAPSPQSLMPNPTGSTNPFRQSAFVNQQTGQAWQNSQQGTMGGLEHLETIPVFPRPGQ